MEDANIWLTLGPVVAYAVAKWATRVIPDDATGVLKIVRMLAKTLSLHAKDNTGGVS